MKILVGIPTHKRPQLLRECLESLASQTGQLPAISVFVADNDPARQEGINLVRELAASFRFPLSATLVAEPGISAVRNAILEEGRRSGADSIAMIDDDETASAEWLSSLVKVQEATGADIVGGPVQPVFGSPPPRSIVNSRMFLGATRSSGATSPPSGAGNFLVSARALCKSDWPLFDSEFGLTGGEDAEWFTRLRRSGLTFAWARDAVASETVPLDRLTSDWILRRAYRCGNSDMRINLKNRDWTNAILSLAKSAATLALAPLLVLPSRRLWVRSYWSRAAGKIAALFGHSYREYLERHNEATQAS